MFKRVLSYLKDTTTYGYRLNALCQTIPDIIDRTTALEYIICYRNSYLPKEYIDVLIPYVVEGIKIGRVSEHYLAMVLEMKVMDANIAPPFDPFTHLNLYNRARY